ncbi:uncharacterized protein LOC134289482 [Aedes albopictus]|uniref:Peptidase A2 domain-containing protein n=1 Tax=Aedes albopictus TaxID=7160 RepID=A0ABM1XSB7_AEDAL
MIDLEKLPCDDGSIERSENMDGCTSDYSDVQAVMKRCFENNNKSDRALVLGEKLEALEESRRRMDQELDIEIQIKRKEMELRLEIEKKRLMSEKKFREKQEEEEKLLQENILRERKYQLDRMKANQRSFLDNLKKLDAKITKLKTKTKRVALGRQFEDEDDSDTEDSEVEDNKYIKKQSSDKGKHFKLSQHGLGRPQCVPTKAQLAARSGMSKALPTFCGKTEEWPLFYGAYQASNEACGYTDVENLVRLQACLKGPALDMVRGQLILPKSVPRVIEKLHQLFGRPEQLLQSHLDKIRSLKPPEANNLAGFIPFGTVVEQLCEHLEAAEIRQHLINPLLIQELVDKLPHSDKRGWVRFKRRSKKVSLRTFTDFVSEIVSEACEANVKIEYNFAHDYRLDSLPANTESLPATVMEVDDGENEDSHPDEWKDSNPCEETPLQQRGDAVETSGHIRTNTKVLFRMVPVHLHYGEKTVRTLALLDEGSSVSLVEKGLADKLGVHGVHEKLTIEWTAGIGRIEKDSKRMDLWISGDKKDEQLFIESVHTVEKLKLPAQSLNAVKLSQQYQHIRGLPISSYSGRPEILIGVNNIHLFAPIDSRIRGAAEPIAVKCKLGWTVYGPGQEHPVDQSRHLGFHKRASEDNFNGGYGNSTATEKQNEEGKVHKPVHKENTKSMFKRISGKDNSKGKEQEQNQIVCKRNAMSEECDGKSRAACITGSYGLGLVTTSQKGMTVPVGNQCSNRRNGFELRKNENVNERMKQNKSR